MIRPFFGVEKFYMEGFRGQKMKAEIQINFYFQNKQKHHKK